MGLGRRKNERREPQLEAPRPHADAEIRLSPDERIGAPEPPEDPADRIARMLPLAHKGAANDDNRRATRGNSRGGGSGKGARRKRSGGGGGRGRFSFRRLAYWGLVLSIWGVVAVGVVLGWVAAHLPPIQSLEVPKRPPSITILGQGGKLLATRGEMGGAAVPLKDMPKHLPNAFIAIEDRRFHSHYGVDPVGIARALSTNVLRRGVAQGGSTITQQLAKNLFLTQERTVSRKLEELLLAFWLEWKFSKGEILELYLNRIYFGAGAYGVEAAAQRYFGKSARKVSVAEAAMLAGLVKSPSRLAPTRNPEGAERRGQLVIAAMAEEGFISEGAAKSAFANPAGAVKPDGAGSVNYVADYVMDVLNDLLGRVEQDVVVETSIDPALQQQAETALVEELAAKGDRAGVGQGAMVVMTPDGAIRALVGGRNYGESQFNRAIAAKRQPGSAFKPFVFLAAIERGLTPGTLREDRPIEVKGWRPENYTREYQGPVTLSRALAQSINTVAVRLAMEVGPQSVVRTAHRLGIASKLDPNASIALGTSEVSLLELVGAYAPFANGGMAVTPRIVERVKRAEGGKVLYRRSTANLGRVVDDRAVGMMNAMMQETIASGTARKGDIPGLPAAGKTGTSQDFRDAWFVGYTANMIAGVWLGNDDSSPTKKMTGGGLPVDIWARFMRGASQGIAVAQLPGAMRGGFDAPARVAGPNGGGTNVPAGNSVPGGGANDRRPQAEAGLDGWLLDRLFGR